MKLPAENPYKRGSVGVVGKVIKKRLDPDPPALPEAFR